MIDDSEYHWRLIAECADSPPAGPLSKRPYLDAALRAVGCVCEGDPAGDVLRAACQELMTRRLMMVGEDD